MSEDKLNRRNFFKKSAAIGAGLIVAPYLLPAVVEQKPLVLITRYFHQKMVQIDPDGNYVWRFSFLLEFNRQPVSGREMREYMLGHPVFKHFFELPTGMQMECAHCEVSEDAGTLHADISYREVTRAVQ